jgi:hypothetical protein
MYQPWAQPMVTIIENIPDFGRIDTNREKDGSPKQLKGIFSQIEKIVTQFLHTVAGLFHSSSFHITQFW